MKYIRFIVTLIACVFCLQTNAQNDLINFESLMGKKVIFPTYDNGKDYFPFVYTKECFYTGKNSKKNKVQEPFIGVPVTIKDVTVLNLGKSSEKLCVLFANNLGQEYSLVVPLYVSELNSDMQLFVNLFHHAYVDHPYQNSPFKLQYDKIKCLCYNYQEIQYIEKNFTNKEIKRDWCERRYDFILRKDYIFKKFQFTKGSGHGYWEICWDKLEAVLVNGLETKFVDIAPMGINSLHILDESWLGRKVFVNMADLINYFK